VELDGLPLIPLADGKLGRFAFATTNGTDAPHEGELNTFTTAVGLGRKLIGSVLFSFMSTDPVQLYFLVEESEKPLFANAQDILGESHVPYNPQSTAFTSQCPFWPIA
jgi:hypothetical protein